MPAIAPDADKVAVEPIQIEAPVVVGAEGIAFTVAITAVLDPVVHPLFVAST